MGKSQQRPELLASLSSQFGSVFGPLLLPESLPVLLPSKPIAVGTSLEEDLTVSSAFGGRTVVDARQAECCLAGAWLFVDDLEASHRLSQKIPTPAGSHWHAIMHRREGDFSNSSYWYRRGKVTAVTSRMGKFVSQLVQHFPDDLVFKELSSTAGWSHERFVNACELNSPARDQSLRVIQYVEMLLLFDDCYSEAVARENPESDDLFFQCILTYHASP